MLGRADRLICALSLIASVAGHASLIQPPPRNAIDSELPAWSNGKHPMTGWIEPYNCRCVCAQACYAPW